MRLADVCLLVTSAAGDKIARHEVVTDTTEVCVGVRAEQVDQLSALAFAEAGRGASGLRRKRIVGVLRERAGDGEVADDIADSVGGGKYGRSRGRCAARAGGGRCAGRRRGAGAGGRASGC